MTRTLYNLFIDQTRRRNPADDTGFDSESVEAIEALDEHHQERSLDRERFLAQLEKTLPLLSPDQRTVFIMHDMEGYTLKEIEDLLSIPLGTLKSRLHRARATLRARVAPWANFLDPFE